MSTEPKSNYHYHREAGTEYFRNHIRAHEAAKMQRIVAANTSSGAGEAIRRNSETSSAKNFEDKEGLLSEQKKAKPHWTTEERWQKEKMDKDDDDGRKMDREEEESDEDVTSGKMEGVDLREVGEEQEEKRKGRKVSDFAMTAATGYVPKPDRYGLYPI